MSEIKPNLSDPKAASRNYITGPSVAHGVFTVIGIPDKDGNGGMEAFIEHPLSLRRDLELTCAIHWGVGPDRVRSYYHKTVYRKEVTT